LILLHVDMSYVHDKRNCKDRSFSCALRTLEKAETERNP
jgi:hypothetical protein